MLTTQLVYSGQRVSVSGADARRAHLRHDEDGPCCVIMCTLKNRTCMYHVRQMHPPIFCCHATPRSMCTSADNVNPFSFKSSASSAYNDAMDEACTFIGSASAPTSVVQRGAQVLHLYFEISRMASDHFASFTRELEFRARLFRKPLDAAALAKLHPPPEEVLRTARRAGATPDFVRAFIATIASRTVQLEDSADGDGQGTTIKLLSEDGVLLLADAEWSESWKVQ